MAEKTEFLQAFDDAILDANSLERFINGSDSETVLTRLSAKYPTLQKAIKELFENVGIAGRFRTVAELENSDLTDGDYALVADESLQTLNGIYIKQSGTWNKSKLDFISAAENVFLKHVDHIYDFYFDNLGVRKGKNIFDGKYHIGGFNDRSEIGGDIALRSDSLGYYGGTSNIAIIPVRPNQTYSIKIHELLAQNEIFRVAAFTDIPSIVPRNIPLPEIDKKDMGTMLTNISLDTTDPVDMDNYAVTVTTLPDTNYLLVMIGTSGLQPKLQVEEGEEFTSYEEPFISFNDAGILKQAYEDFSATKGVNLFSGEYKWAVIYGLTVDPRLIMNSGNYKGVLAEVKIDKNTTYTISSPDGHLFNRFRVGLVNSKPFYGRVTDVTKIDTVIDVSDEYKELTITTNNQSEYLIVYLSNATGVKPRLQVEKGSQATPYTEPYNDLENTLTKLTTKKSQNLLDKKSAIPAQITNTDNELLSISRLDGYPLWHLIVIPVEGSELYTLSSDAGFVDTNKIYSFAENPLLLLNDEVTSVEGLVGSEITEFDKDETHQKTFNTLSDTKFIVLELATGNLTSNLQFEKGSEVTLYKEPYVIESSLLETGNTHSNTIALGKSVNLNNIRPFHILTDIDSLYVTENPIEGFFSDPMQPTSADIIQLYDQLVADFPEFITKEVLGQDPHGYDVVSYTTHPVPRYISNTQGFSPSNSNNVVIKPLKIVITSAVHGLERVGVYSIYYLIRDMLRGSDNDKALAYLKRNVQFVICPIVNRSGFDDFTYETRTNGNVNRDFIQGEVSLPESIILKEFLDSHKDMDFYIDFHNSRAISSQLGYLLSDEEVFREASAQIFQELGVVWQEREPRLDQDPRAIWGFTMGPINGTVAEYVSKYLGVPGIIPETRYTLPNVDTKNHYNKDVVRLGKELMVNCIHMCLRESRRVNA